MSLLGHRSTQMSVSDKQVRLILRWKTLPPSYSHTILFLGKMWFPVTRPNHALFRYGREDHFFPSDVTTRCSMSLNVFGWNPGTCCFQIISPNDSVKLYELLNSTAPLNRRNSTNHAFKTNQNVASSPADGAKAHHFNFFVSGSPSHSSHKLYLTVLDVTISQ